MEEIYLAALKKIMKECDRIQSAPSRMSVTQRCQIAELRLIALIAIEKKLDQKPTGDTNDKKPPSN